MDTVLITGNTYPVRNKLRDLGGIWNSFKKGWEIPKEKAEEANAIVSAAATSKRDSPTKKSWVPCGYPGCSPTYCDECDGKGKYGIREW